MAMNATFMPRLPGQREILRISSTVDPAGNCGVDFVKSVKIRLTDDGPSVVSVLVTYSGEEGEHHFPSMALDEAPDIERHVMEAIERFFS